MVLKAFTVSLLEVSFDVIIKEYYSLNLYYINLFIILVIL